MQNGRDGGPRRPGAGHARLSACGGFCFCMTLVSFVGTRAPVPASGWCATRAATKRGASRPRTCIGFWGRRAERGARKRRRRLARITEKHAIVTSFFIFAGVSSPRANVRGRARSNVGRESKRGMSPVEARHKCLTCEEQQGGAWSGAVSHFHSISRSVGPARTRTIKAQAQPTDSVFIVDEPTRAELSTGAEKRKAGARRRRSGESRRARSGRGGLVAQRYVRTPVVLLIQA